MKLGAFALLPFLLVRAALGARTGGRSAVEESGRAAALLHESAAKGSAALLLLPKRPVVLPEHDNASYEPPEIVPAVVHQKLPGQGYQEGSPLYERQASLQPSDEEAEEAPAEEAPATVVGATEEAAAATGKTAVSVSDSGAVATEQAADATEEAAESAGDAASAAANQGAEAMQQQAAAAHEKAAAAGVEPEVPVKKKSIWACWYSYPFRILLSQIVYVALVVLAGALYYQYLTYYAKAIDPDEEGRAAKICNRNCGICVVAACCPLVRWAATVSGPGVSLLNYWVALAGMLGLSILSLSFWFTPSFFIITGLPPTVAAVFIAALAMGAVQSVGAAGAIFVALLFFNLMGPFAFVLASLLLALGVGVGVVFRQKLRHALGRPPVERKTLNIDILAWCCCLSCVLAQEAREVEATVPPSVPSTSSTVISVPHH